jgi:hypothetical protein
MRKRLAGEPGEPPFRRRLEGRDDGRVSDQRHKYWGELIAEQEAGRQKARPFCRERGIGEYSFYKWRRRLRQGETVGFALLETVPAATASSDPTLRAGAAERGAAADGPRPKLSQAAMMRTISSAV